MSKSVYIDIDGNDDWIKTPENIVTESDIHDALAKRAGLEDYGGTRASAYAIPEWKDGAKHPLEQWFSRKGYRQVDEGFALRLKRGGPKWERTSNEYERDLRNTYLGWADQAAQGLVDIKDKKAYDKKLLWYIDELISLLIVLGNKYLPAALSVGLGGMSASPEAEAELKNAIAENQGYLQDSLAPSIEGKMQDLGQAMQEITLERLQAKLKTFTARVGSYSGAFWALLQIGFGDRVQQQEEAEAPEEDETGQIMGRTKIPIRWFLDPSVVNHCETCLRYGDRTYPSWGDMIIMTGFTLPARGTICNGNCRCSLAAWIDGEWVRLWAGILSPGTGRLPAPLGGLFTEDDWHQLFNEPEDFGGAGSGNFGHKGVPGQHGGSAASGARVRAYAGSVQSQADAVAQDLGLPAGTVEFPGTTRTSAEGYPVLAEYDRKTGKIKVYEDAPNSMDKLGPVLHHEAMHAKTEAMGNPQLASYTKEVIGEKRWKADAWRAMKEEGRQVSPFAKQQWDTQSGNKATKETLSEIARLDFSGTMDSVSTDWKAVYSKVKGHGIEDSSEDYGGAGSGNYGHKGVPGQRGGSAPAGAGVALGGGVGGDDFEKKDLKKKKKKKKDKDKDKGKGGKKEEPAEDVKDQGDDAAWQKEKQAILDKMEKEGYQAHPHPDGEVLIQDFEDKAILAPFEKGRVVDFETGEHRFDMWHGDKDSINPTKAELENMRGSVLSHNHPGSTARGMKTGTTSFSPADVTTTHKYEIAQVRAVGITRDGKNVRYTMTPEPGWQKKISQVELREHINDVHAPLLADLYKNVDSGKITIAQANDTHWDSVWKQVEKNVYADKGVMMNYQEETF